MAHLLKQGDGLFEHLFGQISLCSSRRTLLLRASHYYPPNYGEQPIIRSKEFISMLSREFQVHVERPLTLGLNLFYRTISNLWFRFKVQTDKYMLAQFKDHRSSGKFKPRPQSQEARDKICCVSLC